MISNDSLQKKLAINPPQIQNKKTENFVKKNFCSNE